MSSNCSHCGTPKNACRCAGGYRQPHYQGHGHFKGSHSPGQVHNHYYNAKPGDTHPGACAEPEGECGPIYKTTGAARPLSYGTIQVRDGCGKIKPHSWVKVTFADTPTLAPIWSRPTKEDKYLLKNPVQTNYNGEAQIYFAGGPVDVTYYCDDNGQPGTEVISRITNYGGYVDEDFAVDQIPVKKCPDGVAEPLIKIGDGANCNLPAIFMTPKYLKIMLNIAAGEVAGYYSDVIEYYACLGVPLPNRTKVYADCQECQNIFVYRGTTCDQSVPPDPCDVDFDDEGLSPCWARCNPGKDICDTAVTQTTAATHALDCINGILVKRPINTSGGGTTGAAGKAAVINVRDGTSATALRGQTVAITNFTSDVTAKFDPDTVFTNTAGGVRVNFKGVYGINAQVRQNTNGSSNGTHIAGNGVFINGVFRSLAYFGRVTPDSEGTSYGGSANKRYQVYSGSYLMLEKNDVIALAARSDSHSIQFHGEFHMALIREIV